MVARDIYLAAAEAEEDAFWSHGAAIHSRVTIRPKEALALSPVEREQFALERTTLKLQI
jgi:hypothetical protein